MKRDISKFGVHWAIFAKHLQSEKQNETIIPDWLFKEHIEKKTWKI